MAFPGRLSLSLQSSLCLRTWISARKRGAGAAPHWWQQTGRGRGPSVNGTASPDRFRAIHLPHTEVARTGLRLAAAAEPGALGQREPGWPGPQKAVLEVCNGVRDWLDMRKKWKNIPDPTSSRVFPHSKFAQHFKTQSVW